MNNSDEKISAVNKIAEQASDEYKADIYIYKAGIYSKFYENLMFNITKTKNSNGGKNTNAILILITDGGSAKTAFDIVKAFHTSYDNLIVFAPNRCKSAGTMVALGANLILMDDVDSELGPLDIQLSDKDHVTRRTTGLRYKNLFDAVRRIRRDSMIGVLSDFESIGIRISNKEALEYARKETTELALPIMGQINPNDMADDYRDMQNGYEFATRIARKNRIIDEYGIEKLVWGYHGHGFPIDRKEACNIFEQGKVLYPSDKLRGLLNNLKDINEIGKEYVLCFPMETSETTRKDINNDS